MVKIIEFNATSFLTQSTAIAPGADNQLHQGKGSRYEVSNVEDEAGGFKKIKIPLAPGDKTTWFVLSAVVDVLEFSKLPPTSSVASSRPSVIEFTYDSYLKQNPADDGAKASISDNAIFQGKGAKCEVYFTGAEKASHREVRIPIKPGGIETWWVFDGHIVKT